MLKKAATGKGLPWEAGYKPWWWFIWGRCFLLEVRSHLKIEEKNQSWAKLEHLKGEDLQSASTSVLSHLQGWQQLPQCGEHRGHHPSDRSGGERAAVPATRLDFLAARVKVSWNYGKPWIALNAWGRKGVAKNPAKQACCSVPTQNPSHMSLL